MFYPFHFYCIYHLINMKSSLTLLCLVVWVNVDASSAQTAQGVPCDPPPKVENAIVEIPYKNKYIDGLKVNYECRKSFEIEGLKKITCENGSWTTPPPTCKPSCPDPPSIQNGDFTKELIEVEGVITEVSYQCSRQYTLSFT
uniref:Sushi domain-containing protein n=1 Tax=Hucho hucho TaxID=62062 RepID=A0A4W5LV31_9TELE